MSVVFHLVFIVTDPKAFTNIHIQNIYEGFHNLLGEVKDGKAKCNVFVCILVYQMINLF